MVEDEELCVNRSMSQVTRGKNTAFVNLIEGPNFFQYLAQRQGRDESDILSPFQAFSYLLYDSLQCSIEAIAVVQNPREKLFWQARAFFVLHMYIATFPDNFHDDMKICEPTDDPRLHLAYDQIEEALYTSPVSNIVGRDEDAVRSSCLPRLNSIVERPFLEVYNPLNGIWYAAFVGEKGSATKSIYQKLYHLAETFRAMGWGRELSVEDLAGLKEQIAASDSEVGVALRSSDPVKVTTVLSGFQHALDAGRKIDQQTQERPAVLQANLPLPMPLVNIVDQYVGIGFFAPAKQAQPEPDSPVAAPPQRRREFFCAIL